MFSWYSVMKLYTVVMSSCEYATIFTMGENHSGFSTNDNVKVKKEKRKNVFMEFVICHVFMDLVI